eukprot:Rhum_TRINITY_DN8266_c0_g2::Rhum_TRINITY_DN8266_c0_g2_i1::g.27049::m.27049
MNAQKKHKHGDGGDGGMREENGDGGGDVCTWERGGDGERGGGGGGREKRKARRGEAKSSSSSCFFFFFSATHQAESPVAYCPLAGEAALPASLVKSLCALRSASSFFSMQSRCSRRRTSPSRISFSFASSASRLSCRSRSFVRSASSTFSCSSSAFVARSSAAFFCASRAFALFSSWSSCAFWLCSWFASFAASLCATPSWFSCSSALRISSSTVCTASCADCSSVSTCPFSASSSATFCCACSIAPPASATRPSWRSTSFTCCSTRRCRRSSSLRDLSSSDSWLRCFFCAVSTARCALRTCESRWRTCSFTLSRSPCDTRRRWRTSSVCECASSLAARASLSRSFAASTPSCVNSSFCCALATAPADSCTSASESSLRRSRSACSASAASMFAARESWCTWSRHRKYSESSSFGYISPNIWNSVNDTKPSRLRSAFSLKRSSSVSVLKGPSGCPRRRRVNRSHQSSRDTARDLRLSSSSYTTRTFSACVTSSGATSAGGSASTGSACILCGDTRTDSTTGAIDEPYGSGDAGCTASCGDAPYADAAAPGGGAPYAGDAAAAAAAYAARAIDSCTSAGAASGAAPACRGEWGEP